MTSHDQGRGKPAFKHKTKVGSGYEILFFFLCLKWIHIQVASQINRRHKKLKRPEEVGNNVEPATTSAVFPNKTKWPPRRQIQSQRWRILDML